MDDLAVEQHWMMAHIVTDTLPGPMADMARDRALNDVVRGSPALGAAERLRIYTRGYVLRLVEALRADFPVLRAFVGDTVFDLFAAAYLTERRSRSPSLYDLGDGFADYLERTRPMEGAGRGTLEAIPASLARLERAIGEASRAPGPETANDYDLLMPAMALLVPQSRLRLPASVRLLRLDFDFGEMLAATERGDAPPRPRPKDVCIAVARSGYRVRAHELDPPRFAWLAALSHDGADVLEALVTAGHASRQATDALFADLIGWLPLAIQDGLVTRA